MRGFRVTGELRIDEAFGVMNILALHRMKKGALARIPASPLAVSLTFPECVPARRPYGFAGSMMLPMSDMPT
jgi:hypothetical protein